MGNFYDDLVTIVDESNKSDNEKKVLKEKINQMRMQHINIMFVGATGAGKTSTIKALFKTEDAKIGTGATPKTKDIQEFKWGDDDNFVIYDCPGLGDDPAKDESYIEIIKEKLEEKDEQERYKIDLVVVILEGGSRDLGTPFKLIDRIPSSLGGKDERNRRIFVAINQADQVMKGYHWDRDKSKPDEILEKKLKETADVIRNRISEGTADKDQNGMPIEGTGLDVTPVCYSAGYFDECTNEQKPPYNLEALLLSILQHLPEEKRTGLVSALNTESFERGIGESMMEFASENIMDMGSNVAEAVIDKLGIAGAPIGIAALGLATAAGAVTMVGGAAVSLGELAFGGVRDFFSDLFG